MCLDVSVHEIYNWRSPYRLLKHITSQLHGHYIREDRLTNLREGYLTIIPRAREWALSHKPMRPKAEWAIDSEAKRARGIIFFSKTQLVGQKYRNKTTLARKRRFSRHCFGFQSRCFSLPSGL